MNTISQGNWTGTYLVRSMALTLAEVMVKNVITVEAEATVKTAVEVMNKHEIGCLVVVEKRKPIGIVTERDILKRAIPKLTDPEKVKVSGIMSKPLFVGKPKTSVSKAVKIMFKQKIKKLPVVEDGRLVGLVTLTDVIRSPDIMRWLKKFPTEKAPKRMKKVIAKYMDIEHTSKRCPIIVEHGYAKNCQESECMWWLGDECAICKLTKQISNLAH